MSVSLLESQLDSTDNPIVSPYSLEAMVHLLELGANDTVMDELRTIVERPDTDEINRQKDTLDAAGVRAAESAWAPTDGFFDDYVQRINDIGATVEGTVDPDRINDWVSKKTDGCIEQIVDDTLDPSSAVLLSALYFDEDWAFPFDEENTESEPFYGLTGERIGVVPMMRQTNDFLYGENDKLKVLELPYENDCYARFYLPKTDAPVKNAHEMYEAYDQQTIEPVEQEVEVELPKLKFEQEHDLQPFFETNDLGHLFEPGTHFSRMMSGQTWIDEAAQSVFFDLDEEGTEAAAATSAAVARAAAMTRETFRADRPFVVELVHPSVSLPLFTGLVRDPSEGQDDSSVDETSVEEAGDEQALYMGVDALKEAVESLLHTLYYGDYVDEEKLRASVQDPGLLPRWAQLQLVELKQRSIYASPFEADRPFRDLLERAFEAVVDPDLPAVEDGIVDLKLVAPGPNRMAVMKEIRSFADKSLKEVQAAIDQAPTVVKSGVAVDDARTMARALQQHGASVELDGDSGPRPVLIDAN